MKQILLVAVLLLPPHVGIAAENPSCSELVHEAQADHQELALDHQDVSDEALEAFGSLMSLYVEALRSIAKNPTCIGPEGIGLLCADTSELLNTAEDYANTFTDEHNRTNGWLPKQSEAIKRIDDLRRQHFLRCIMPGSSRFKTA